MQKPYKIIMKQYDLETDAYDRSYILYNIGLIHTSNGDHGTST